MMAQGQGGLLMLEGFADPVDDSQRIFRQILQAVSRPGCVVTLDPLSPAPVGLNAASIALCLALLDHDTSFCLDGPTLTIARQHIAFHTGAPLAEMDEAAFTLIADGNVLPDLSRLPHGDAEYPERGATLIIQVAGFDGAQWHILRGPGVDGTTELSARGLDEAFWVAFAVNQHRFPLGFDTILVHDNAIVALPRSTVAVTRPVEA
ncbi:MAG: phosphonate C-P lyase system protein PhnH [Rhodospirillaceae bacterium]|nr:phosphonate C-P lyase system protein PhnH [Rhodospirillaceae bacterium]